MSRYVFPNIVEKIVVDDKHEIIEEVKSSGLTKRELFAAMAMQGVMANNLIMRLGKSKLTCPELKSIIAKDSVEVADALIKELEAEHGE